MSSFQPQDPEFEKRVRQSFEQQRVMKVLNATLGRVEPGIVEISIPYSIDLTQQDGFIHAGIIATIADSACGYAAYTLMPANSRVLSVEYKVNLLRPAAGEAFLAHAEVVKAGKTITVVTCDVIARANDSSKTVATMLATMIQR
jgi:uncharacterized protein (TIGR00369 family)